MASKFHRADCFNKDKIYYLLHEVCLNIVGRTSKMLCATSSPDCIFQKKKGNQGGESGRLGLFSWHHTVNCQHVIGFNANIVFAGITVKAQM